MISETYSPRYCRDPIEKIKGYEEAISSPEMYDCHHVLELTLDGQFAHHPEELERMGMYWNRPAYELEFLKHTDHQKMHMKANPPMKGRAHSDVTKSKISSSLKGQRAWNKGIPCSEDSKRKQSETKKKLHLVPWNKGIPLSEETKKKLSKNLKGRVPWNKSDNPSKQALRARIRREKLRQSSST